MLSARRRKNAMLYNHKYVSLWNIYIFIYIINIYKYIYISIYICINIYMYTHKYILYTYTLYTYLFLLAPGIFPQFRHFAQPAPPAPPSRWWAAGTPRSSAARWSPLQGTWSRLYGWRWWRSGRTTHCSWGANSWRFPWYDSTSAEKNGDFWAGNIQKLGFSMM